MQLNSKPHTLNSSDLLKGLWGLEFIREACKKDEAVLKPLSFVIHDYLVFDI